MTCTVCGAAGHTHEAHEQWEHAVAEGVRQAWRDARRVERGRYDAPPEAWFGHARVLMRRAGVTRASFTDGWSSATEMVDEDRNRED